MALVFCSLLPAHAVAQSAVEDRLPPDEGVWKLHFDVQTAEGGVRLDAGGGWYYEPYHLRASLWTDGQTVAADGSFSWEERGRGYGMLVDDEVFHGPSGASHHRAWYLPASTASGQVQEDRLTIELRWTGAEGEWTGGGGSGVQTLSADGGTVTVTGPGATYSTEARYWTSTWELRSEGVERCREGDFAYDIEVYRGEHQAALPMHPPIEALPVSETIYVSHLRVHNRADLSVALEQVPDPASFAEENVTLQFVVTNHGPDASGWFDLNVHAPPYVEIRGAAEGEEPFSDESGTFQFVLPALPPGESRSVPVILRASAEHWPADAQAGFVAVSADVSSPAIDPVSHNNRLLEPVEFVR